LGGIFELQFETKSDQFSYLTQLHFVAVSRSCFHWLFVCFLLSAQSR